MEVGVVGKPNVGKSTFFRALTAVEAEIANFPFTTIKPNVGVGYVKVNCPCGDFSVECRPNNSICRNGSRMVPVKVIDVAGLVPGAHEGKGLGNQFLDDLRRADVLIHVVDISGRTDEKGEPASGHDPEKDIKFLEEEIDLWFYGILKKNWNKIFSKVRHTRKDLDSEIYESLAGLEIRETHVSDALRNTDLKDVYDEWSDSDLRRFTSELRRISKPMVIAANKIDMDSGGNFERLKDKYLMFPVCSEAELALRQAEGHGVIRYVPGESSFETIKQDLDAKQNAALEFIKKNVLEKYGSTGAQAALNAAVFDVLKLIVAFPVENENRLSDAKGNVLPDAFLLPAGSTASDLAYKVHSDIGDKFIGAIDCRTKKKIGRDHVLQNCDVVKILASK